MNNQIYVTCTSEEMKSFIRGETLFRELVKAPEDAEIWLYTPQCETPCYMTFDDLRMAISNMIRLERKPEEFFYEWYERIYLQLGELFGIPALVGYPDISSMDDLYEIETSLFPKNEYQMSFAIFDDINFDEGIFSSFGMTMEEYSSMLHEYLERMNNLEYNMQHHLSEWRFTDRQKQNIVHKFKDEETLAELGEVKKALFRKMLEELVAAGDLEAIKIKGYACYGYDNPVYECDWFTSRDCMLILVEKGDDEMQAQAANTLGYIYYYGRCNDGVPEYDLAYKYFSLACFFGYYEATYKVGDMLAEGKGVPQNKTTAYRLYQNVYEECLEKFQRNDEKHTFADAALRMGRSFQNGIGVYKSPLLAYYFYLQAKVGIDIRMKKDNFFGDKKVLAGIEQGLADTKATLLSQGLDVEQPSFEITLKKVFSMLVDQDHEMSLKVEEMEDSQKLTFTRIGYEGYDPKRKMLVTFPEVSYCQKTDQVILYLPKDIPLTLKNDANEIIFDDVKYDAYNIRFYKRRKRMAIIPNKPMKFVNTQHADVNIHE